MQREKVFFRHNPPKVMTKQKPCVVQSSCHHFGRKNLSLAGCSSAEPASVSVQHFKFQNQTLYLQTVKKSSHVHVDFTIPKRKTIAFHWLGKNMRKKYGHKMKMSQTENRSNSYLRLFPVILSAVFLNLAGAVMGKYLALNLDSLRITLMLGGVLALVYLGRILFWIWAGKHFQLSYLYPFVSISFVLSLGLGHSLFNELITIPRFLGSVFIVLGVFILSRSKNRREA